MNNILVAKDVCKTYVVNKREHNVLNNVSFQIKEGEFISVMGPSGSGKSTLLYNVSGMDRMTSGRVIFNGREISAMTEKELSSLRLQEMGFVFQQINLLKNLGIFDNIVVSAHMVKNMNRKKINSYARELMDKAGISELAENDISQASGGQLQRAAICRSLINNPHIIFGDEPTGALNSKSANEIMTILKEINDSGTTIMLVTHDIKVASKTDRILFMIDGKIEGELNQGKRKNSDRDLEREQILSRWLMKMGW